MKTVIERLDHQGRGIAYYNGKVTFIPYTLVGEEVIFELVKEHKKYIEGKLIVNILLCVVDVTYYI